MMNLALRCFWETRPSSVQLCWAPWCENVTFSPLKLPEMLHGDPGPMGPWTRFLLQNLGLLAGGAIMLCIALFEDHIAFNLGDI